MINKLLLILIGVHTLSCLSAQITFQKTYGGSAMDNATSIRPTNDGGYIVAGTTTSFGSGGRDVILIKTNGTGDTLWTKTFGGTMDNEYGFCVQQTSDEGYIVSGVASSFFDVAGDIYLIKTDHSGDTIWTKTFGGIGYEWGAYIEQTSDGGYIISGQTPAYGAGGFDACLVKLDSNGNLSWSKSYGGSGLEVGSAVQQTVDGGYVLCGQIDTYGAGGGDFYALKTDSQGDVIWSKTYGRSGTEGGTAVKQTSDGGYIIAGTSENKLGPLGPNMCLIKTNAEGDTLWSKLYGGEMIDECYDVIQTSDGNFVMCGKSLSFSNHGDYDVYVVKVNQLGEELWAKTYGASGVNMNEIGNSIRETNDGGLIISGESLFGFGVGMLSMYVIKTDEEGNAGCYQADVLSTVSNYLPTVTSPPVLTSNGGIMSSPATIVHSAGTIQTDLCSTHVHENWASKEISAFPNPFHSIINFSIDKASSFQAIKLFDATGKIVFSGSHYNLLNDGLIQLNLSHLAPGLYHSILQTDRESLSFSLIKE